MGKNGILTALKGVAVLVFVICLGILTWLYSHYSRVWSNNILRCDELQIGMDRVEASRVLGDVFVHVNFDLKRGTENWSIENNPGSAATAYCAFDIKSGRLVEISCHEMELRQRKQ